MDKRYQRGNQNPYIEDEQTTQWTKDTKGVIRISFVHCVVCSSSIYGFWLPLWYLLSIVLSVRLRYTDSDYPFGIFCPLCCLFVFDQTTQWTKDTKGVIRIRISKTNRQHNGQNKTDKRTNNDVQSNTVNSGAPEGSIVICNLYHSIFSIVAHIVILLIRHDIAHNPSSIVFN
jgi:hypothetical protein